ncbi:hypothetical protein HP567_013235 [Brevibacillus sp. M2.1A]|uniref:hypothetical protein n=1 Tax=Brevibacillus sp. M2.1A TaxID=2738980 RepID=UPI001C2BCB80|nr:hypothetical protein [Brevibacillus sp. M2.1A]MCC8435510.1 hypothetical protein [Brevibacillus sp. M2.1A]
MLKWLEPAIEQRILEVSDACEEQTNQLYEELIKLLRQLESSNSISLDLINKIENIYVLKTNIVVKHAYKAGFNDGMYIGSKLK